jgi:hypothetical protein
MKTRLALQTMSHKAVFSDLGQNLPKGWRVVHAAGAGVYLWPDGLCEFRNLPRNPLLHDWEILFELCRLQGGVKLTARARPGSPNFDCFIHASKNAGCKFPKGGKANSETRGVAVWRLGKLGADAAMIARGVRAFLAKPPTSLTDFIKGLQSCCPSEDSGLEPSPSSPPLAATSATWPSQVELPPQDPPTWGPGPGPCPNQQQLIESLVRWIQADPYPRLAPRAIFRGRPASTAQIPQVIGWDNRLTSYAYAKSQVFSGRHLAYFVPPIIARFQALAGGLNWNAINSRAHIPLTTIEELEWLSETTCIWGGVAKPTGYADTWRVLKSAFLGGQQHGAPMDSGWTKVASFATDHCTNAQTIWDSRVSTSIIWRSDQILPANCQPPGVFDDLFIISSKAGTRPRPLSPRWPVQRNRNAVNHWQAHFAGSIVVREMVAILNNPLNNYPRMPLLGGGLGNWDVFGVGLVLFMDGY